MRYVFIEKHICIYKGAIYRDKEANYVIPSQFLQ